MPQSNDIYKQIIENIFRKYITEISWIRIDLNHKFKSKT